MIPHADIAAVILAAGESRRMGSPKPLLPFGDETALEISFTLFANAGICDIRVVTGHLEEEIRNRHPDLPVKWMRNDAFHQGMLSSVKMGLRGMERDRSWFFILPVDTPLVRPGTLKNLLGACSASESNISIFHPVFGGRRGHPPLLSTRLVPGILAWDGDRGLGGFLDSRTADTEEVPVIDEFILRDMDTPADYRSILDAFSHRHIPTSDECEAMLSDPALFREPTASHCRMVARLAAHIGKIMLDHLPLDMELITAGALLHDIGKGEKKHAAAGARRLREMGFAGIAHIVSSHMDIDVSETSPLWEAEVVYLADKLVKGSTLVPLSVRFEHKLAKYGHDPSARAAILKRRQNAEIIIRRVEKAAGTSFQAIMDGFSQDGKQP